jgi:hypothetical protein
MEYLARPLHPGSVPAMNSPGDNDPARLRLVLDAIDIVLRRLELLHPSPDVVALRAAAVRQLREAQDWERAYPSLEEQERLMKRVLFLHVGTAKLERTLPTSAPLARDEAPAHDFGGGSNDARISSF